MFGDDGQVIHFNAPKGQLCPRNANPRSSLNFSCATVHAAVPSNVFAIYGAAQSKSITDILPGELFPNSNFSSPLRRRSSSSRLGPTRTGGNDLPSKRRQHHAGSRSCQQIYRCRRY